MAVMIDDPVLGPPDPLIISGLPGQWKPSEPDRLACAICGWSAPHDLDRLAARAHWETHSEDRRPAPGRPMVWHVEPASGEGKRPATSTFSGFVAYNMQAYLRADLPFPSHRVIQEFVNLGELRGGMSDTVEWPVFEVPEALYRSTKSEFVENELVAAGDDVSWVDSLFFRRAVVTAQDRGTPVQHEIRRMTIRDEAAAILVGFDGLDERVVAVLRRRMERAKEYDFDPPSFPSG